MAEKVEGVGLLLLTSTLTLLLLSHSVYLSETLFDLGWLLKGAPG